MAAVIHPTAIISEGAVIGEGTSVGPYSIIGPKVVLGRNNKIGPHVVIEGNTTLGDGNQVYQFASLGSAPQDLKYRGEDSRLEIGSSNTFREGATLNPGTTGGGMLTKVGNRNLFMVMSHVGHDGIVGDENVFANSVALAGHVEVGNGVILGGLVGVHQYVRLGDFAILSGGSMVVKDVPPYCTAQGDRCGLVGINHIALERRGHGRDEIMRLKALYRDVFREEGKLDDRVSHAKEEYADLPLARKFLDFFADSKRGVTLPRRSTLHGGSGGDGEE